MRDSLVADHCAELNRCNQRGGRVLSMLDLLEAETLPLDLAAYLVARISQGDSFLVGARPGGAGKTTIMCACLNFLPPARRIVPATAKTVAAMEASDDDGGLCLVCHEIGSGAYFAYLWDEDLRRYCALSDDGVILATNLHADDLDEAHHQICVQNGVPEQHFHAFAIQIFLQVEGGFFRPQRTIDRVYSSDGRSGHKLVYDARTEPTCPLGPLAELTDPDWHRSCRDFLKGAQETGVRTIEETRRRFLESCAIWL